MAAFTGKTIIITGASEGIGRALALALARQQPNLVLAARNRARLEEAARECEAAGARALAVPTDVTDPAACAALVDRAVDAFGALDVLCCNAGATMWARLEEVSDLSIYERLMRLNYLGGVYCTFHALPHLKRSRGLVVGVSSVAGLTGVPCRTGYAASKHAQFGFFDSLRIELAGTGVDVIMVAPDFVVTEIHRRALKGDGTPLERSPLQESKVMSAAACAALIVEGMEQRRRLVIGSLRGKVGRWVRLLAPWVTDRIARRAIESGS